MNRTIQRFRTLTIILLISTPVWAEEESGSTSKPALLFSAEAYVGHVRYLAGDELAGRLPGSEGSAEAADYIIEHFKQAGCQPAGEDGTWFQPFEVRQGKRLVDGQALLEVTGLKREWKVRKDWIPFPFTDTEDVEGPLAFAGYGIQAVQHDYDDYDEFDAEGKILLILRYEAKDEDPEARFGGEKPSRYALFTRKARTASKHGAKALLIVNPPNRNPDQDELYEFNPFLARQSYQLPMAHITRELANAMLRQAGAPDLKTLQEQLDKERKPLSRDLGLTVKLHPGVEPNQINARNVLGVIPGDGSTAETIVVGAHRDHLGIVPRQFQRKDRTPMIHNGADDNASGTAAVIELARAIGHGPKLRRNVLFIAFDAEEMGLLGSRHFVKEPTIDLENIRAMVNFDMIGRLKQDRYTVFGTSTGKEFPALIEKYAEEVGLEYKAPGGMAGGSDHTPFQRKKIPAVFAFTGIHKQYHQPEDDWELIDADGAAQVLQMWYPILVELANMEEGPTYTKPTRKTEQEEVEQAPKPAVEEQAEAQRKAEAAQEAAEESDEPPSRSEIKVRLGVVPDPAAEGKKGMVVQSVVDGGPAKAAGMKDGDRIIKIGEDDIRDVFAYMRVLKLFNPGDEVDVVVVRGEKELTLKVKLQPSRGKKSDD